MKPSPIRPWKWLVVAVLVLFCPRPYVFAQKAQQPPPKSQQQPGGEGGSAGRAAGPPGHVIVGEEEEGFTREREQWFYSNRSLPDGTVPAALRVRALEQLEEMIRVEKKMGLIPDGLLTPPIDFIGPTSWTSIGPQGIMVEPGNPFSGNPLNAGRVSAIAVNALNKDVV